MKTIQLISFKFIIDEKEHKFEFDINKQAKPEDAEAIGIVMQKWITEQLEQLL